MDKARSEARRTAAEAEIGKHGRLVRGPRDGKLLSAGMAPFFRIHTPRGYGILTPRVAKPDSRARSVCGSFATGTGRTWCS